jgi:hypothetical protein
VLWEQHGDPERAKIYLTELVNEYKKEIKAGEQQVPEFFEPGYATGWAPGISGKITGSSTPSLLTATAPMPHADPNDPQATIPLPPRPHQLLTGKLVEIGPRSSNLPTPSTGHQPLTGGYSGTGSRATGARQRSFVTSGSMGSQSSVATTGGSTGARAEEDEGGNWGLVAALAVPLLLLVIVGLVVGLGAFSSLRTPKAVNPDDSTAQRDVIYVTDDGDAGENSGSSGPETPGVRTPVDGGQSGTTRGSTSTTDAGGTTASGGLVPIAGTEPDTPEVVTPEPATPKPQQTTTTRTPAGTGTIRIDAEPWAKVYVDDKSYGDTPVEIKAVEGVHRVTFRCMGTGPKVHKQVEVKVGQTENVFKSFPDDQCPE